MFLYDQCLNTAAVSDFDAFDLNDIDTAFARVTTLKYQQVFSMTGKTPKLDSHHSILLMCKDNSCLCWHAHAWPCRMVQALKNCQDLYSIYL